MSGWMLAALITLVLGIIVANILLLKQTAHMKFKKPENPDEEPSGSADDPPAR